MKLTTQHDIIEGLICYDVSILLMVATGMGLAIARGRMSFMACAVVSAVSVCAYVWIFLLKAHALNDYDGLYCHNTVLKF